MIYLVSPPLYVPPSKMKTVFCLTWWFEPCHWCWVSVWTIVSIIISFWLGKNSGGKCKNIKNFHISKFFGISKVKFLDEMIFLSIWCLNRNQKLINIVKIIRSTSPSGQKLMKMQKKCHPENLKSSSGELLIYWSVWRMPCWRRKNGRIPETTRNKEPDW